MDNADKKVQDYKNCLEVEAENLLVKIIPETILKINHILETTASNNRQSGDMYHALNAPRQILNRIKVETKIENGAPQEGANINMMTAAIPSNAHVLELLDVVKPYIRKMIEDCNSIKMWISLMIPKMEVTKNFGVFVQEDALAVVRSVQGSAQFFFNQISKYFSSRGEIVAKIQKFPQFEDYRQAVLEMDDKQYLDLWVVLSEIRNRYCSLSDIITKNLDKIKTPAANNTPQYFH